MKIIITGSSGLIGTTLLKELEKDDNEIFTLSRTPTKSLKYKHITCDISQIKNEDLNNIRDLKADILFHLAWNSTGNFSSENNIDLLIGTINLVKAFISSGGKKTIFTGTYVEYSDSKNKISETALIKPSSFYAFSKNSVGSILQEYCNLVGHQFVHARLFSAYGLEKIKGRLVSDLIDCYKNKTQLIIKNPFLIRDYIHASDVARSLIALANSSNANGIYNIGTGIGTSIKSFVDTFSDQFDIDGIIFNNTQCSINQYVANVDKLSKVIDVKSFKSVKEGIADLKKALEINMNV